MRQRSIIASTIRKIQVPAYVPDEEGVHVEENKGVLYVLVKTIDMPDPEEESMLLIEPIELIE